MPKTTNPTFMQEAERAACKAYGWKYRGDTAEVKSNRLYVGGHYAGKLRARELTLDRTEAGGVPIAGGPTRVIIGGRAGGQRSTLLEQRI
jgi:hypothetical protein